MACDSTCTLPDHHTGPCQTLHCDHGEWLHHPCPSCRVRELETVVERHRLLHETLTTLLDELDDARNDHEVYVTASKMRRLLEEKR
jgi:primosomal protein N'